MEQKNIIIGIIVTIIVIGIMFFAYRSYVLNEQKSQELNKPTNTKIETDSNKNKKTDENETIEDVNYEEIMQKQLASPQKGETIATLKIKDFGDIKVKFFKKEAPIAVENFITHAKNGYYDGLKFHRVINEFMIQGGDPQGTGMGGESIWKEPFEKEVSIKRFPFRGTLCMASTSEPKSLGSQYFITQANYDKTIEEQLRLKNSSENIIKAYKKYGGSPHLFLKYTVFGQVYQGMDIVDKIAKVEVDEKDKPLKDVIVEKIIIEEVK
ncbi:MAG: peptidylprolyl isomerase [Clostridium sp.]